MSTIVYEYKAYFTCYSIISTFKDKIHAAHLHSSLPINFRDLFDAAYFTSIIMPQCSTDTKKTKNKIKLKIIIIKKRAL